MRKVYFIVHFVDFNRNIEWDESLTREELVRELLAQENLCHELQGKVWRWLLQPDVTNICLNR